MTECEGSYKEVKRLSKHKTRGICDACQQAVDVKDGKALRHEV